MNIQEIQNNIGKREIKFRAWSGGKMMYDNTTPQYWSFRDVFYTILGGDYIPMQYTGLKDKNGKEIYEGDIVRYGYGNYQNTSFVRFSFGKFMVGALHDITAETDSIEVIGNIFENPELLG